MLLGISSSGGRYFTRYRVFKAVCAVFTKAYGTARFLVTLTFSLQAVLKTAVVFLIVTIFISFQGYFIMYRYTLLDLFQAESKSERVNKVNSKRSIVVVEDLVSYSLATGTTFHQETL